MSQLKGLFLIMHVGLIPTYLTDNIDNETIKETIFYLGNLANLSTFEHLLMVHTGKVKRSWKGLTDPAVEATLDVRKGSILTWRRGFCPKELNKCTQDWQSWHQAFARWITIRSWFFLKVYFAITNLKNKGFL